MRIFLCLSVLFLGSVVSQSSTTDYFPLVLNLFSNEEADFYGARCLDGSPAGYYFQPASSPADANNWVISLQAGGFCVPNNQSVNSQYCGDRVGTYLGSSSQFPNTTVNPPTGYPMPPETNDYNQVLIPYCSGDVFVGTLNTTNNGFYISGHLIVAGVLDHLSLHENYGNAEIVVASGLSAGGIGVFVNLDYMMAQNPKADWYAVVDAGWFVPYAAYNPLYTNLSEAAQTIYQSSNGYANQDCVAQYSATPWLCLCANYSFPFITAPMFVLENLFDQYQLISQAGSPIVPSTPAANLFNVQFGENMRATLETIVSSPLSGVYATATYMHGVLASDATNGVTAASALSGWYNNLISAGSDMPPRIFTSCDTPNCLNLTLPSTTSSSSTTSITSSSTSTQSASTSSSSTSNTAASSSSSSTTSGEPKLMHTQVFMVICAEILVGLLIGNMWH